MQDEHIPFSRKLVRTAEKKKKFEKKHTNSLKILYEPGVLGDNTRAWTSLKLKCAFVVAPCMYAKYFKHE